jgi:hypothetical protein
MGTQLSTNPADADTEWQYQYFGACMEISPMMANLI